MGNVNGTKITNAKKKLFLKAYEKSLGNIMSGCKAASISRASYYNIKAKDPDFREKIEEIEAGVGDYVESKLAERIKKGDTTATIFYCKTKLKDRGYVESQRVESETTIKGDKDAPLSIEGKIDVKLIEQVATKVVSEY